MTVEAGQTLRGVATFQYGPNTKAQNVYHFIHTTGSAQADEDVVEAVGECVEYLMGALTAKLVDDISLVQVEVFERVSGEWEPVGIFDGTWAGTSGGDRAPAGLALMIELTKARTGHKDRKYIAGVPDAGAVGDTYDAATLAACDVFVTRIQEEFEGTAGAKVKPCYFNRDTEVTAYYTGGQGAPTVSYQRRRKPGVGLT
jgi:hypothetical protein